MNAETIIRAAENDGLRLALTDTGTVKCIGPKQVTERWAPQLRQHKAEILAVLTAANDRDLHAPERTLSDGDKSALAIAESAIARAALTPSPATRRCIECEHFARVGVTGERCSHPDRSPPGEPARADCLPAHQCERFIHWRTTGAFNAVADSPSNSSSKENP